MTNQEKKLLEQVTFIVDKGNRIVKCLPKLTGPLGLRRAAESIVANMINDQMKMLAFTESTLLYTPSLKPYILNKNQCFAIAKCSPNDTFDEKIGKQIALQKFELRLEKVAAKITATISENAEKASCFFDIDSSIIEDSLNEHKKEKEWLL